MKQEKKLELFKEFLEKNHLMVVDKSSASRRRLTKTLVDMGAKRNQIHSVGHYSEAIDLMKEHGPRLVLSDFQLNGGSGFDLFKEYREEYPEPIKSILILITSNISQSAVAKAAEEDVDSFIIKPYTVNSLEKSLMNAVISKLYPSEYIQKVEEGKKLMFDSQYEEALVKFEEAIGLNKKPSLAHFYHGHTKTLLSSDDEAKEDFEKGLAVNSIHYKCQVGLYELFKKEQKYNNAYEVVRNIAKYFPANPDRLREVIHLCIRTNNFEHMEEYYNLFVELEERTDDAVDYICAGMYVTGKYYAMNNDLTRAASIFDKVGISCAGNVKYLNALVVTLDKYGLNSEAQKLLSKYPSGTEAKADFDIAQYIAERPNMSNGEKISKGLELFNNGMRHPVAARMMIDALFEEGSDKKAQEYLEDAQIEWPEEFQSYTKAA